jgi:hypothetical protein
VLVLIASSKLQLSINFSRIGWRLVSGGEDESLLILYVDTYFNKAAICGVRVLFPINVVLRQEPAFVLPKNMDRKQHTNATDMLSYGGIITQGAAIS